MQDICLQWLLLMERDKTNQLQVVHVQSHAGKDQQRPGYGENCNPQEQSLNNRSLEILLFCPVQQRD